MSDEQRHYDVELHEWLDDRLDAAVRVSVEQHLETCTACRTRLEALSASREALGRLRNEPLPEGLEGRILAAVRAEPMVEDPRRLTARSTRGVPAWAWGLAAAAVLAVVAWLAWPRPAASLVELVANDYRAYRDGALALDLETSAVADVESLFARSGLGFETRVFDLGMMQLTVEGGRVHRLAGRPSALFVYAGPGGRRLVCQMYPGRVDELPEPTARHSHDGIEFRAYERDGVTLVFWQEGDVVCVLTGDGPAEAVIQLAFAKAVKV
jgi:anti-sigma factor RsiW